MRTWPRTLNFSWSADVSFAKVTTLAEDVLHGKYVLLEVGVLFLYFQRHRAALPLTNTFIVLAEIILFEG